MPMTRYWILLAVLLLVPHLPVGSFASQPATGTLIVTIMGLRNYQGAINIAVFATAEGFPDQPSAAVDKRIVKLADTDPVIEFNGLAFGEYAVSVFHDENTNQQLDKNWLGIPKEGVGFSHNPKSLSGPPSFEEAKFSFTLKKQALTIKLIY